MQLLYIKFSIRKILLTYIETIYGISVRLWAPAVRSPVDIQRPDTAFIPTLHWQLFQTGYISSATDEDGVQESHAREQTLQQQQKQINIRTMRWKSKINLAVRLRPRSNYRNRNGIVERKVHLITSFVTGTIVGHYYHYSCELRRFTGHRLRAEVMHFNTRTLSMFFFHLFIVG